MSGKKRGPRAVEEDCIASRFGPKLRDGWVVTSHGHVTVHVTAPAETTDEELASMVLRELARSRNTG